MKILRFILIVLFMSLMTNAFSQEANTGNMDILRDKLKADKKLVVATNMDLTDVEGQKFWPVYEEYQNDLAKINNQLIKVISTYADAYKKGPLPNDVAKNLIRDALNVEEAELKMKRKYMTIIETKLGAAKAARYLQIESKIRAMMKYELVNEIPLVK